ncbi:hypothetical protein LINPERHAP1_LOCUS26214 [Linum perenne]
MQFCTIVPYPNMATLFPSLSTLPFPISRGVPLLFGGMTVPIPFPLGYLKQLGRSSMDAAVATMCMSSVSSEGAMTTMFGKHAMKVVSKAPQCVGPSAPTRPALSIANLTGSF